MKPVSIFFFTNGTCAVCDEADQQMPKYQVGWHRTTIEALKRDGFNWLDLPEIHGNPLTNPPAWWAERQLQVGDAGGEVAP